MSLPPTTHRTPAPRSPRRGSARRSPDRRRLATLLAGLLGAIAATTAVVGGTASPTAAQPAPQVGIEKATNGADADAAPGPEVEPGQAVTWTWTVTAVGTNTLFDLVVSDSSGVVPDCDVNGDGQPDGTNIHPGPVEPGQSFSCTASGAGDHDPAAGPYAATGTVRASDFDAAATFQADDPSHHQVRAPVAAQPGLSIQTVVNGRVADGTTGPLIPEGVPSRWTYVVTNTGNVPLTGVEVSDAGLAVDCGDGGSVVAGPLAPGASVSCTATAPAVDQADGAQSRTGSAAASAVDPTSGAALGPVAASASVTYVPVQVPQQLAFTGPSSIVLSLGFTLTALGSVLLLSSRRRSAGSDTADTVDVAAS